MNSLALDLGTKNIGMAISEGSIATPYKTIINNSKKVSLQTIKKISEELETGTIVVGITEGKNKAFYLSFARDLEELLPHIKVALWDETLTTRQARKTMIKLQVPKMKRKSKEHEVAAAIILQSYLDENA